MQLSDKSYRQIESIYSKIRNIQNALHPEHVEDFGFYPLKSLSGFDLLGDLRVFVAKWFKDRLSSLSV